MIARRRICISFLLPLLCGVAAAAQSINATPTQNAIGQMPSRTIELDVVVTPKSGLPVAELQEKDFTILDNKVPQKVTSFRAFDGSPEPVEVILLIDSVNTSFSHIAYERLEIDKYLNANGGQLSQPTTVVILTDFGIRRVPELTKDGKSLAATLDKETIGLREITRNTGFYGAGERADISVKALQQLMAYEATRPGRKVILWVSPGWPLLLGTEGLLTGEQEKQIFAEVTSISKLLRESRTTIYVINPRGPGEEFDDYFEYEDFLKGIKKPGDSEVGDIGLQVIATQSGGLVLNGSSDIAGMLTRCTADAGAAYRMSFEPRATGEKDAYHAVEVRVARPGLKARTRTGYYAVPAP